MQRTSQRPQRSRSPSPDRTSPAWLPVSFAPERERTRSPVRNRTPSGGDENLRPTPTTPLHNNNGAGTSSNLSPQEAEAAAALLGLSAVTPPQPPTRLVTPSAPTRNHGGASSSQPPVTVARRLDFAQSPTVGSPAGEGVTQRPRGQTVNGEAPSSSSPSPVLEETSGRVLFAPPSGS